MRERNLSQCKGVGGVGYYGGPQDQLQIPEPDLSKNSVFGNCQFPAGGNRLAGRKAPKTKDQRPKTKDQRPETKDQRPKTKDQAEEKWQKSLIYPTGAK